MQHIRQSILLARMARRIAEGRETDRERAKAAMTLIAQQVDPLPQSTAADRPLTPFEALLIGRGTAADRAWIFAEILRQIRVDVVVFLHADPQVPPLLGVLGASEILLFDPLTGFPVPQRARKTDRVCSRSLHGWRTQSRMTASCGSWTSKEARFHGPRTV